MIKLIAVFGIIALVLFGSYYFFNKPVFAPENKFITPSQTPRVDKRLVVIDKNFKNSQGSFDNYYLTGENGEVVKQLVPPPTQLGRDKTGRISGDFKYFVFNSQDTKPAPSNCGTKNMPSCPQSMYGLKIRNLDTNEESYISAPTTFGTSYPYISPDSKKVAYSTDIQTFIYNIETKQSLKVSNFSAADSITWFPDSKSLLISDGTNDFILNTQNSSFKAISKGLHPKTLNSRFAAVTADGRQIVNLQSDGYYLLNSDGSNPKFLKDLDISYVFSGILNGTKKAVFSKYIQTNPGKQQNILSTDKTVIYLYDLENMTKSEILAGNNILYSLSPDGKSIAYSDTSSQLKNYLLLDINTLKTKPFLNTQDNPDPASGDQVQIIDWQ